MALIKCWCCNAEIDDTLKDCPHCKMPVITIPVVKPEPKEPTQEQEGCGQCGRPIPANAAFCPFCGVPVMEQDGEDNAEVGKENIVEGKALVLAEKVSLSKAVKRNKKEKHYTGEKRKKLSDKRRKDIVLTFSCIAIALGLLVGYMKSSSEPTQNYSKSSTVSTSSNSVSTGSSGGSKSETLIGLYNAGKASMEGGGDNSQDSGSNVTTKTDSENGKDSSATYGTKEEVVSADAAPSLTLGQENALKTAKQYIAVMDFSYTGLIEQLEYEGYSHEDAVYGADNCGADWMAEAAGSAKSYMDVMSFSRQSLLDQLLYEGYTQEQAEHGVTSVGY